MDENEKTSMKPFSFKGIFNANEMNYAWIKLSSRVKFATHVICHMDDKVWWWMSFIHGAYWQYKWNLAILMN